MFHIIIAAIGLMLVFEGILPFLSPSLWRRMIVAMSTHSNTTLRIVGLICMLLGVSLLLTAHRYL